MRFLFVSGDMREEVEVPEANLVRCSRPLARTEARLRPEEEVARALAEPIGSPPLEALVSPASTICILVDDATRPTPTRQLLPVLLRTLAACGIADARVRITVANGLHRMPSTAELEELLGGDVPGRFDVGCNDADDDEAFVALGTTTRGTPLFVNRRAASCDLVVTLGCVKAHSFAGFTGGAKSILPGVSSRRTVLANHRYEFTSYPEAVLGDGSKCEARLDMEEAARRLRVFILNVVLDEEGRVVRAVAGDVVEAHRVGARVFQSMSTVLVDSPADLVLLSGSCGSKLSLYSTIVGFDTVLASCIPALRPGGTAVALAQCRQGVGSATLGRLLSAFASPQELLRHLRHSSPVEAQWTAQRLAQYQQVFDLGLVSSGLDAETARRLGFQPYPSMKQALLDALDRYGPAARVLVADRPDFAVVSCRERERVPTA